MTPLEQDLSDKVAELRALGIRGRITIEPSFRVDHKYGQRFAWWVWFNVDGSGRDEIYSGVKWGDVVARIKRDIPCDAETREQLLSL